MLTRDRLGAFIAVLLGAAVVTLTLTLLSSAVPQRPERFGAVTLAVRSPAVTTPADPFPEPRPWSSAEAEALAERLAALPGTAAAVVDRRFYAQPVLSGRPVAEIREGYGWTGATLAGDTLIAGRPAIAAHEVVLGQGVGVPPGAEVTILTGSGASKWRVTGLVDAARLYVADAEAARLSPGVRVIGLTGRPDPDAVRAAAPGATVLTGNSLGELEPMADARTRWIGMQVLSAMAALSVFSCVFVIASTLALSVNQRRREIGLLRAVGATPRQVRFTVLREAALVGLVAGVIGATLGLVLSPTVGGVLVDAGFEPESFHARVGLWPVLAGVLIGPLVAVAGGLVAARRAARVRPLDALRSAEVELRPMSRVRWVAGLLFAAIGVGSGFATVVTDDLADLGTYALLGAMALVVAATLLSPAVVPLIVRVVLRPAGSALGTVVRESALTGARRTASTAAPVLLTVAFSVFIAGNVQATERAYADRRADRVQAGTVLVPDGTPGLTDAAAPTAPLITDVYLGDTIVTAIGTPSEPIGATSTNTTRPPGAREVVLSQSLAGRLGGGVDDSLVLTLADGQPQRLRVSAVVPDADARSEIVLARETVRRHDPSALALAVPIPPSAAGQAPPTTSGTAASGPLGLAGGVAPVGARVVDVDTYAREAGSEEDRLVWIFTMLLVGVSVGYGALAVANTLFMATARRANDYRLLRLAGATPRQVLISVAGESALVVVIGSVLGSAAALLALWGATTGIGEQTGTSGGLTVPWAVTAIAVGTCLLLALVGSVLPARAELAGAGAARERA